MCGTLCVVGHLSPWFAVDIHSVALKKLSILVI
jgi:hypothetical protein